MPQHSPGSPDALNRGSFFKGCAGGNVEEVDKLLAADPSLITAEDPAARHRGWTGLHTAAKHGQLEVLSLLLKRGADANMREAGDHTSPLHWAAANRNIEITRALLAAGADANSSGDVHELDVIGWATYFHEPGGAPGDKPEVASLLVEHGARHHIFSAICLGDLDLVRSVIAQDPQAPDRRMSRFEQGLTALHFAISRKRYDILNLLIEAGADLERKDLQGNTALEAALLSGDEEAIQRLRAAGAREPVRQDSAGTLRKLAKLAGSVSKCVSMINVDDVAAALSWFESIGFKEISRYADDGLVNFGMVAFGNAEIMLRPGGKRGEHDVSLWLNTDKIDELYELLGPNGGVTKIEIAERINDTFYGARQFAIRDPNGYCLYFIQQ